MQEDNSNIGNKKNNDSKNNTDKEVNSQSAGTSEPSIQEGNTGILKKQSFFNGNQENTSFVDSAYTFPDGLDNCFRCKNKIIIDDSFLNAPLEFLDLLVLSSVNGNVYFIPRENPHGFQRLVLHPEIFEKTGIVHSGILYLNSVKSVYRIFSPDRHEKIYDSGHSYIWSNLNFANNKAVFLESMPDDEVFSLVAIDLIDLSVKRSGTFERRKFLYDCTVISDGFVYASADDKIFKFNLSCGTEYIYESGIPLDTGMNLIALRNHLYFNNYINELYFIDTDVQGYSARFTGIKCPSINTVAGYEDKLFLGGIDGWSAYKTNGQHVYTFEDVYENRIGCLNRSILVSLKGNKISFHNMHRFQEADSYTIPVKDSETETDYFVSCVISDDFIMALTRYGRFFVFTNDKMNIKL